ncbi:hypothetical protein [Streptomyces huasconensis]|uniref:hypothetical protein n=1 Tax=Streptomyces huasconensis TaxID=1854574 RepID=UPI003409D720
MKVRHGIASGVVAAVTAGAILVGVAPLAAAADTPSKTAQAAEAIEKATGTADIASGIRQANGAIRVDTVTDQGSVTVTTPATADGTVKANADTGAIGIDLPNTTRTKGIESENGTIAYPDAAKSTDLAVQPTNEGGVRALITVNNANAAKEYRFDLDLPDGAVTEQLDDGSVMVLTDSTEDADVIGAFEAPWAKDVNGNPVPTTYRVENGALIQTVAFDQNTAFPVVADPWWNPFSWNWGKIGKKLKSCGKGSWQFINGDALGKTYTSNSKMIARKLAQYGLRAKNVSPQGFLVAASAGCVTGALRNWK